MKREKETIIIGGIKQSILTLYTNTANPILLIVHGGPGSPDRPLVCEYNSEIADEFTIVCWDQRCSGLSYTKESKKEPLTTELMLCDLKEIVEYLLKKYNQNKLFLAGHSWGAYLGLWFASKYPELLHYYIGTGQGISSKLDEIEKYNFVLSESDKIDDTKCVNKLLAYGKPVNGIYPNNNKEANSFVGNLIHKYGGYIHQNNTFSMKKYIAVYPKYYGFNLYKVICGINYSVKHLTDKMKQNDIIPSIKQLDIPIKLIFGEKDYICPIATAEDWFEKLIAPKKDFVIIKNAAHMVNFEQPTEWNNAVRNCTKQ
ncbi:MAG: alpha/beta hydrolase [Faecalibacterium sp.]|nr:alpha/beta hydrolase [Ruminococcus sp.]MCM1391234.1 alpha/beta hydrolase [Ruminococcus sp.]MCM1484792.1 alpha/beta hydrolase [Faecalibacterium sp.]